MPFVDDHSPRNIRIRSITFHTTLTGYLAGTCVSSLLNVSHDNVSPPVASICVLIYDHIVCFPDEVELMRKSLILREITTSSEYVQGSTSTVVWLFIFMGIAEFVITIVVDLFAYAEMTAYVHLGSLIKGCYAYNVPRFLTLYAAAPLLVVSIPN
ncbi:hypothetical protein C8J57DRAFT_1527723 [Mycena rebaudengoi]|nr:hypothetical protein C8J57DRAFT_1527723 [Mycena rebaudengoi]